MDTRETSFLIRQNPQLRVFEQNEDDATKNVIMMRIEERVADSPSTIKKHWLS